jgi:hypothetical protein
MKRRVGFTDLSRLNETVSPPSRAMLLTRQGISLAHVIDFKGFLLPKKPTMSSQLILHVAMQIGLYLHRQISRRRSACSL